MLHITWIKELWEGKRLPLGETVERGTALPASESLFTVSGGKILLTELIGTITAGLDANATSAKIVATPTVGTARDLCTAVNIASYAIGDLVGISGGVIGGPGALQPAATGGAISGLTTPMIIQAGTIDLNVAAPGQVTGRIRWTPKYLRLDSGASVAAA